MSSVKDFSDQVEVLTLAATFIVGLISFLFLLYQNRDTSVVVASAEKSIHHLRSSKQTLEASIKTGRQQLEEVARGIIAAFRPNIYVLFESPESDGGRKIFLIVQNVGRTTAFDIQVTFSPALESSSDFNIRHLMSLMKNIPVLPPGARIGHVFDEVVDIRKSEHEPIEFYNVKVEYRDGDGMRKFSSEQELSMRPYIKKQSNWFFVEKS